MAKYKFTYQGPPERGPRPIPATIEGLEDDGWAAAARFVGTREAVMDCGLVPARTPVPGEGGFSKTRKSFFSDSDGRRCAVICWHGGTYALELYRFPNERKVYDLKQCAAWKREQRIKELRELDSVPSDAAEAKAHTRCELLTRLLPLDAAVNGRLQGLCRLDDASRARLRELIVAMACAVGEASFTYDPEPQRRLTRELRELEALSEDVSFGGFMEKVLSPGTPGGAVAAG